MSELAVTLNKTRVSPTFRPKSSPGAAFSGIPAEKPKEKPETLPLDEKKISETSAKSHAALMLSQSMGVQKSSKPDEALHLFNEEEPSYEFTEEELEELKKKYDVENMSREEQNALLKDLADRGIISNKDVSEIDLQIFCVGEDMDLYSYSYVTPVKDASEPSVNPYARFLDPVDPGDERSILDRLKATIAHQENNSKFLIARRDELAKDDIHRDIQGSLDAQKAFADHKRQLLTLLEQLKR